MTLSAHRPMMLQQAQRFLSGLILVLMLLVSFTGITRAETVILSTTDFPPYEFANPENGLKGFDLEVIEAAFKRVGIETEFTFLPWKRAVEQSKLGQFAGLFSCSYLADREEFFIFSDTISESGHAYFLRKDFSGYEPTNIEDAKSLKVASVLGWAQLDIMKDAGAQVVAYRSEELLFKNLLKGMVDYAYLNLQSSRYRAKLLGLSDQLRYIPTTKKTFHICFSKKWPGIEQIVPKFSRGLALIKEDGTYDQIHNKYQ